MVGKEIEEIKKNINNNCSFVLKGGAGSGKTFTLLQTIDYIYAKNEKNKICCITFTNAAVLEIKKRCPYSKLFVSTIHDFLWAEIEPFQKNLLIEFKILVNQNYFNLDETMKMDALNVDILKYSDIPSISKGIISHKEIIKLASILVEKYALFTKILSDKYDYLLIDEYQDAFDVIINLSVKLTQNKVVVGYFGDSMQAIYEENYTSTISIEDKLELSGYKIIVKEDNFRCSTNVINYLNKIRSDLSQNPANNNKIGSVNFAYSKKNLSLDEIKNCNIFRIWDWNDSKKTKELYLTHGLIAKELGFNLYLQAFSHYGQNKNSLAVGKKESERHSIVNYLFHLAKIIETYNNRDYYKLFKLIDCKIFSTRDKIVIKNSLSSLSLNTNLLCMELVDIAIESNILKQKGVFDNLNEKSETLLRNLERISFNEIIVAYRYAEQFTPFSTQHNIKGLEFNNVFVYLDNGRWRNYDFTKMLLLDSSNKSVYDRTLKLYYVCCSRAKDNLVIYMPNPSEDVINKMVLIIGERNIYEL